MPILIFFIELLIVNYCNEHKVDFHASQPIIPA